MVNLGSLSAVISKVSQLLYFFDPPLPEPAPSLHNFKLNSIIVPGQPVFRLNEASSDRVSVQVDNNALKSVRQVIPQYQYSPTGSKYDSQAVFNEWESIVFSNDPKAAHLERTNDASKWTFDEVLVPDISDKKTVLTLAYIAANAYVPTPHEGDWSEVGDDDGGGWNEHDGYGWDADGLRGYLFASDDNSSLIVSIKGTSTALFGGGGPTAPNDKVNDNLLFSCCCARISYLWDTVCDCFMGDNQCDERCLERELYREDRYYRQALQMFDDAMKLYPDVQNVWITGHSLGGALSSMIGRTYGLPVVTFEAPGEQIPVKRLHLPTPPGIPLWEDYVWHFGNNADPIYLGTCSGSSSSCSMKGYAMESVCHTGQLCIYDVKKDLGWHESIVNHRIHIVIDDVLEKYDQPAKCVSVMDCVDCVDWEFIDPLTLPDPSAPTLSSTTLLLPTTTVASSTTSVNAPTSITQSTQTSPPITESCIERAWYGACKSYTTITIVPTPSTTPSTTPTPTPTLEPSSSCVQRAWYGACESYTTIYN